MFPFSFMTYAYDVPSLRASRSRVLGTVYIIVLFSSHLDLRASRSRVLVYNVGHPFGDSPFLRHRR